MYRRKTFDDLREEGATEEFTVAPDSKNNGIRVIRKNKKNKPLPEIYRNETELKKDACDKILSRLPKCKLLKSDNMPLRVGNGRKVKTRNPGMADHHLCITGLFVAIEAKMPGKDLDPDQVDYRDEVLDAGGIFIMYHSLDELVTGLKKHRLVGRKFKIR